MKNLSLNNKFIEHIIVDEDLIIVLFNTREFAEADSTEIAKKIGIIEKVIELILTE